MNTKIIIFLFLLVLFILFAYFFVNNVKIKNLTLAELFEFTNLSKNNISKYLEEKYGMKNIRFTNIDLHTDGYRNSLFSYNPPKYDGWVIASVKANGIKKFTVLSYTNFLEQGIETQKLCYDNYQKSEIKNAISSYLEELVGQPAEYQEIVVEDTTLPVFLTYSSKLKNNNKYLFANKYDGNLLDFISNDNISCNVDNYYLNAKTVNIPVEHFNSIKLTNYSSEKALKERLSRLNESTSWWSHYLPYIIDSNNYNVRTANISYELIKLEQTSRLFSL